MVDDLRRAFELAHQCSDEEQRRIAQMVLEELEDQQWEESPAVRTAIEEASTEIAADDYVTLDELDRMRREHA